LSTDLSSYGLHPTAPGDPSTPRFDRSQVQFSSFFQYRIQIITHESNFYVTGFLYMSNTRDVAGRVSCSQADFDVATTTSRWILAATASRWIVAANTSSRASRLEFQYCPHLWVRYTGRRHRHLHLEGKPLRGECLLRRHRCRNYLLLRY
jgi:hypothetical protein